MTQLITPKEYDYTPGSMSFSEGFLGPRGNVGYFMLVDYEKARNIIENMIDAGKPVLRAELGLDADFDMNSTTIYDEEGHREYEAHDSSSWAEPILIIHFSDNRPNEMYSCWRVEGDQKQLL